MLNVENMHSFTHVLLKFLRLEFLRLVNVFAFANNDIELKLKDPLLTLG